MNSGLGLGVTARAVRQALETAGIPHHVASVPLPAQVHSEAYPELVGPIETTAPVSLLCLNADQMEKFARRAGSAYFGSRRIIGVWFWETEDLPAAFLRGADYLDALWVFSPFVAGILRRANPGIPVKVFSHPLDLPPAPPVIPPHHRFAWPGCRVFQFSFDFNSCVLRKNPEGVADAYLRAFPQPGDTRCVIKSINGDIHPLELLRLRRRYRHRDDVIFIDGYLPDADYAVLAARTDCYVSLHRSEGLGLTLLEAMARGIPCIATGYSGNTAFMNDGNSWLIPWKMIPVGPGSLEYPANHHWAEPDVDAAAAAMRAFVDQPEHAIARAREARGEILAEHDARRVGEIMRRELEDLLTTPGRPKPAVPATGSWTKDAEANVKEIRSQARHAGRAANGRKSWLGGPAAMASSSSLPRHHADALANLLKAGREREQMQTARIKHLERRLAAMERQLHQLLDREFSRDTTP